MFAFMNAPTSTISHEQDTLQRAGDTEAVALVRDCIDQFPCRRAGSADERGAQLLMGRRLAPYVDTVELVPLRFTTNLYAVIAFHFGIGLLASLIAPASRLVAMVLHLVAAVSYLCDSARWGYLLRHLVPKCASQNLVAIQKATQPLRRRLVLVGHIDAAPGGRMFKGPGAKVASQRVPPWITAFLKPLRWAVLGLFLLAAIDAYKLFISDGWAFPGSYIIFTALLAVIVVTNVEAAFANVVPGANDNLSGCAAVALLAQRLAPVKPADTEIVYVMTGCEEAGTGGAYELARQMRESWDPDVTSIVVLDGLAGGSLVAYREGEVVPQPADAQLLAIADEVAEAMTGQPLPRYYPPAGATDEVAFAAYGYKGISVGTVDRDAGMPAHYHQMSDTADNLDADQFDESIDFVERLCRRLMAS